MNNKRNATMMGLIYFILFVAYNIIVYLIFQNHSTVFWISYFFMFAAFVLHIVCVYFITKNLTVQTIYFGIPLFSFSLYFLYAELFCSLVFMIFQSLVSVKITVGVQALLFCVFLIIAIISIMTRDAVVNVDAKIKKNVNFIKGLAVDVEMLMQQSTSSDIMLELKKLFETIKYADPMTNASVAMQEQMIMQSMMELRNAFDLGNALEVKSLCGKINLLFIERNKKLMIAK